MRADFPLGFLLTLARVSSAMAFVPLPGLRNSPEVARIAISLGLTVALFPAWPAPGVPDPGIGLLTAWMLGEAAFGVAVGLSVAFLAEGFVIAAQVFGLQAGYAYATTIDPNSQADASVLQVFAQLAGSLLFLSFGLDREVIRIFARSLEVFPAGTFSLGIPFVESVTRLGAGMWTTGLRLAMPVVALLLLTDVALALLGRIHSQLQLLTLAFPAKMLSSMAALAALSTVMPVLFRGAAEKTMAALAGMLAGGR